MSKYEELQNQINNLKEERKRKVIKQLVVKSIIVVGAIVLASFIPKE